MSPNDHTLHYGQDRLLTDRAHRTHIVLAGVGYGKTRFGPLWMEYRRMANPELDTLLMVAPNYKLLHDRMFGEYMAMLKRFGYVEKKHFRYNKQDKTLSFGSQKIIGMTGERPENIVSYNAGYAWSDETALINPDARKNLVQRLRVKCKWRRQMLQTTTPQFENWFYDLYGPDQVPDEDEYFASNKNTLILKGQTAHNPYLDEDFLQALLEDFGWDEEYYNNYVLGRFGRNISDKFYFSFNRDLHTGSYNLQKDLRRVVLTWDSNIGQMTWALMQEYVSSGNLAWHVVASNNSTGHNVDHACTQFIDRFEGELRDYTIQVYGDASLHARSPLSYETGYDIIERLLKPKFPGLTIEAPRGNSFVYERKAATNRAFKTGCLFIDKSCPMVIKSAAEVKSDHLGNAKKGAKDKISHGMEAVDHAIVQLRPMASRKYGGVSIGV